MGGWGGVGVGGYLLTSLLGDVLGFLHVEHQIGFSAVEKVRAKHK